MVDLQRYRATSGQRNYIERIKANDYKDPLPALFITIFLASDSDFIASQTSLERLEYPIGLSMALKRSDSTWLKKLPN